MENLQEVNVYGIGLAVIIASVVIFAVWLFYRLHESESVPDAPEPVTIEPKNEPGTPKPEDDKDDELESITVFTPMGPETVTDCKFLNMDREGNPPFVEIEKDGKETNFTGMPYILRWRAEEGEKP